MVFSSLTFVCVFLPLVVALYFGLPKSLNNWVLVVASFVFYGWGDPVALLLIGPSVAVNFQFGRLIDRADSSRRRHLLVVAVAMNLAVLIAFKYANFIIDTGNALLGLVAEKKLPQVRSALPLGISFFTFHIISYLV